jgi:PEGA domain
VRGHPTLTISLGFVIILAAGSSAYTQSKPAAACRAYFTTLETDQVTVGVPMLGLNKPQREWYDKHGAKGEYAGICYWDPRSDESQIALAKVVSDGKFNNIDIPDAPLYLIGWGESLKSAQYQGSYQTQEQSRVTVTDDSGNSASGTVTTPVTHNYSGTKYWYDAGGTLSTWDSGSQKFVTLSPLHNHNRTVVTSASTSLLKDAMDQIKESLLPRIAVTGNSIVSSSDIQKVAHECHSFAITSDPSKAAFRLEAEKLPEHSSSHFAFHLMDAGGSAISEFHGNSLATVLPSICQTVEGRPLVTAKTQFDNKIQPAATNAIERAVSPGAASSEISTGSSEPKTLSSVATVSISSSPDGAEIYADGAFVGNVPAMLKLSRGKHTIRLTLMGYKEWSREITTMDGSEVHLTGTLEKDTQ